MTPVVVTATSADQPEEQRDVTVVAVGELDADLAAGLATWSPRAACRGVGAAVFFDRARRGDAAPICSRCAVAEACLWWAMAVEEGAGYRFGLWGGTTPTLRSRIARAAGPGYARHRLRLAMTALSEGGEETADGCEAAA